MAVAVLGALMTPQLRLGTVRGETADHSQRAAGGSSGRRVGGKGLCPLLLVIFGFFQRKASKKG